jgi:RNA polymerase sigma factor (sigma-70 family)
MPKNSLDSVLRYLRRVALTGHGDDARLLEKFARDRDEAAFEKLVLLHGPMILGLCRRLLRHDQDAEDAFQATFLTLARKANTIGKRESLASWLYKVAYRVACRARGRVEEVTNRMAVLDQAGGHGDADVLGRELRGVLDEEMAGLQESYRRALLLCCFQGKSLEEAGRLLACPKATVATWLARGKEQLRRRLNRRGWALSTGVLATVLSDKALAVPLPPGLATATLACVFGKSANTGALAAKVFALSDGVLRMMWLNKMKLAAGVVLAVLVAGTGAGLVLRQTWAGGGEEQAGALPVSNGPPAKSAKAESDEDFIRRTTLDLLGKEPTVTEIHFFTSSKDPARRQKLIDLLTSERQHKKAAEVGQRARHDRLAKVDNAIASVEDRIRRLRKQIIEEVAVAGTGDPTTLSLKQKWLLEEYGTLTRRLIDLDADLLLAKAAQLVRKDEDAKDSSDKLKVLEAQREALLARTQKLYEKAEMAGKGSAFIEMLRGELAEIQDVAKTLRRERESLRLGLEFGLDDLKLK